MSRPSCGECTLCCRLLPVESIDKPQNTLCGHCVLKKGCKIYSSRPQACREFECAYLQMENVHIDLRPDNCKIIFERMTNDIFFGTQDPRFDMTTIAQNQIAAFQQQGFSVIVSTPGKKTKTYLAKGHTKQYIDTQVQTYLRNSHGSS